MSNTIEQREYSRRPVSLSVQVRLETGVLVEGRACNVSLNGLFLVTERSLPLGSRVKVIITAGNAEQKMDISCPGIVSRLDERGVAIEMGKIDEQSMHNLYSLMQTTVDGSFDLEKELEKRLASLRSIENTA